MLTKSDLMTFALGLAAALLIDLKPMLEAIAGADNPAAAIDLRTLGAAMLAAGLRYVATRIPELVLRLRAGRGG